MKKELRKTLKTLWLQKQLKKKMLESTIKTLINKKIAVE